MHPRKNCLNFFHRFCFLILFFTFLLILLNMFHLHVFCTLAKSQNLLQSCKGTCFSAFHSNLLKLSWLFSSAYDGKNLSLNSFSLSIACDLRVQTRSYMKQFKWSENSLVFHKQIRDDKIWVSFIQLVVGSGLKWILQGVGNRTNLLHNVRFL